MSSLISLTIVRPSSISLSAYNICSLYRPAEIKDQPIAIPSDGDFHNTNWAQWVLDTGGTSYGYSNVAYLGLAKPGFAHINADSYLVFALCLQFTELDCLGTFQDRIKKRQPVPVRLHSRTIEKIRLGQFNED